MARYALNSNLFVSVTLGATSVGSTARVVKELGHDALVAAMAEDSYQSPDKKSSVNLGWLECR